MDPDLIEAQLGEDVKSFLESPTGKMIADRAEIDINNGVSMLRALDPYKFSTLAELQNHIATIQRDMKIAGLVSEYLADAVTNGETAFQRLTTEAGE